MKLRVASRGSKLALTQTHQFLDSLKSKNPSIDFEVISFKTQGDLVLDQPLTSFGGVGVFVKELELALQKNQADIAVHSLKDVPAQQPEDLALICYPQRESHQDLLITVDGSSFQDLKHQAKVGTSSPRRKMQLSAKRPDLEFLDLRGNIDTRLRKLQSGEYDAILLAAAGVKRLGLQVNAVPLEKEFCVAAPGQGSLVIEARKGESDIQSALSVMNHSQTESAVKLERIVMAGVEAGCKLPFGAFAKHGQDEEDRDKVELDVFVGSESQKGSQYKRFHRTFPLDSLLETGSIYAQEIRRECVAHGVLDESPG